MLGKYVLVRLCLTLMFHDIEDDGTHNYLVHQPVGANVREWMVAFSNPKDVHWRDGCYEVEADCDLNTMALDDPAPDDYMSWGYPRLSPICNAYKIEGEDFKWEEKSRSSSSPKGPPTRMQQRW